jgi:hypothetical protein
MEDLYRLEIDVHRDHPSFAASCIPPKSILNLVVLSYLQHVKPATPSCVPTARCMSRSVLLSADAYVCESRSSPSVRGARRHADAAPLMSCARAMTLALCTHAALFVPCSHTIPFASCTRAAPASHFNRPVPPTRACCVTGPSYGWVLLAAQ